MTTDLILHSTEEAFTLAERISRSALVPAAYRGKPVDTAIAMLYGAELGFPPLTALQRVVVINGKPTCDAQGMVSLIRQAGHSISGTVSATDGAKITGKRGDNGDEMTVEWGPADAQRAGLKSATYDKFPADMFWARAVSQLGRRLFADVLLSVSYVPEEAAAIPVNGSAPASPPAPATEASALDRSRTVRQPPGTPEVDAETGEIVPEAAVEYPPMTPAAPGPIEDAEVVEEPATAEQVETFKVAAKASGITTAVGVRTFINKTLDRSTVGWGDLTSADIELLMAALSPAAEAAF